VVAVSLKEVPAAGAQEIEATGKTVTVNLLVNGATRKVLVEPRWSLAYVLREVLGLTGTKIGCERGEVRRLHGPDRREGPLFLHDPCGRG